MKDFVSDNDQTKNIEEKITAVPEKKPIVKFTGKAGENNNKCQNMKMKSPLCALGVLPNLLKKSNLTKHITAVHEKKMPFMCSICPSKFSFKRIESVED